MARLFHHSFPGSKAALFFLEQSLVLVFAMMGAALAGLPLVEGWGEWALEKGPAAARQWAFHVVTALASNLPGAASWAVFTVACSALAMYAVELYDLRQAIADRSRGGRRAWIALTLVAIGLAIRAARGSPEERAFAAGALVAAIAAVAAARRGIPTVLGPPIRLLVVGKGQRAERVLRDVGEAEVRVDVVGHWVSKDGEDLVSAARALRADWIVFALEASRMDAVADELVRARMAGFLCLTPAMLHERLLQRIPVEDVTAEELAFSEGFDFVPRETQAKRALDVALSLAGLLLALPLLAVAALAIRIDSRGPILYRQERVGKGGRIFTLYKLRTMLPDAEAEGRPQWASEKDPRTTRVGRILRKARIDEIPQLWSVLKGDMSFVGPRPERPYFVGWLEREIPWYGLRLAARPGLTGWAQLKFPYGASVEDAKRKLEYDLYYLKNASIFLDMAIVFHTIRHVVLARGSR